MHPPAFNLTVIAASQVQQLQRLFFKHQPKLRDLALANCGTVEKATTLRKYLGELEDEELKFLVTKQLRQVLGGCCCQDACWVVVRWADRMALPHHIHLLG